MMQRIRFNVQWTDSAVMDLGGVIDFIAQRDLPLALQLLREIRLKADSLYHLPERGRVVPELQAQEVLLYRELLHKSWRIVYRIENSKVYVLAVLDARRNAEDLLLNRLTR
jgi:plasmid stabilization system protein ParE